MQKAVIFGAGPAGLAAAHTLVNSGKEIDITLIDQGKRVEQRDPTSELDRSYGVSGVGAYSDGKFIFDTIIGKRQIGTNIHELLGKEKEIEYLIKSKQMFGHFYEPIFGPLKEMSDERKTEAEKIRIIAARNGMDYTVAHDYHIGTDRLPELMGAIQKELEERGVKILTEERVVDFEAGKVYTEKDKQRREYAADFILIAPGRGGSYWLQKKLDEKKIKYTTRPIDIGFRIEADSAVLEHLTKVERDVKFEFRHPNGDLIRTFCVCPHGKVAKEGRKPEFGGLDFCLVNGASSSKVLSNNTNFSLLVRMPLREGCDNASWGVKIAENYRVTGSKKITLHRMAEFKQERSSKKDKMPEWRVQPTLDKADYIVGDARIGMSGRILDDLRYGIKKLSAPGLMDGLDGDDTLIYAPEIKMHGINISTTPYLESTSVPSIFFAGDGTGFSRGIGGAQASGILAAEGIIAKL